MAERKRRPPSGKVKPGTPHPTKAHTVRGFDGRWVTRKSYNAAKKAREVAKKGGSLVKRASSAVTKASKGAMTKASKAGELLKIRKGDKGIVRGIKDTYKFGKDTRRSANAVYKAGKVTRKVHDQLVKGGKEFVKGTVESGKAVRRVVNRLKPGGKIVRVSKPKPKFNYDALPKQKGGAIVKSPSGKMVKSPGGKMVKSPGGKLTTRANVKGQKYTAPKTRIPTKGKVKVDGKTVYTKRDIKGDVKSKVKGAKSRVKQTVNKAKSGVKKTWATRPMGTVAKEFSKPGKLQKIKRLSRGLRSAQNLKSLGIGIGLDWAADQAVDRTFRAIAGKNKMSLKEYRAERDARLKAFRERKRKPKPKSTTTTAKKPKVTRNKRGRVVSTTTTKKPLKTWKNPYKGPKQPKISTGPYKGGAKTENIGTYKGGATVEPLSKKKVTKKTTTNKTPYWQSPRQKQEPKKKKLTSAQIEANERKAWEKKTRNSPARKSGAFTADQLWQRQKEHRKWKKRMGRK